MTTPYPQYTKHYSTLAPLGFNEMLVTHAGLSYNLVSSLYLDLAGCGTTLINNCRFIALNYNDDRERSVAVRYLPYKGYVKVRSPIRLSGGAKLRSTLGLRRYEVTFRQTENSQQIRKSHYEAPQGFVLNPRDIANDSVYVVAPNGDLVSTVTLDNPPGQVIRFGQTRATEATPYQTSLQRVISHLPAERGYIYEVTGDLRDVEATESFNNQKVSACKILLPSLLDGHIPASRVGHDMNNKSPADIAWVLLYAIGAQRPIYVLTCLKGLVHEALHRKVIIQDDFGNYTVNPEAAWGFENKFIPQAPSTDSGRDIGDNALLGWAISRAVRYLQDRTPLEDWSLTGTYTEFKAQLTQLLLAQGYLCAYAVSRQSWWCCDRAEGFAFNYGVLSQRASYLTSLFLDDLLQVTYDHFIHQQAARLYVSLSSAEDGVVGGRYFKDFNDVSNDAVVYKGFWLWAKEQKLQEAYDYLLANYVENNDDLLNTLVTYTLSIIRNKLEIEEPLPVWVTAHRGDNQQAAMGVFLPLTKTAKHFLPIYLTIHNIDVTGQTSFELKALEAFGQVGYTLSELRRFWPRGYRWGSAEVLDSVNSVLGAMLHADANLYFDYFLLKGLALDARSLSYSQGIYVREWFEQLLGVPYGDILGSDNLFRSVIGGYVGRDPNDRESIVGLLQSTLGYTEAVIVVPQPKPYSLIKDVGISRDTFVDYLPEVTDWEGTDYLDRQRAQSIVYKPTQEQLIDETVTNCSSLNRITAYGGKLLRRAAGFPYRNVPVSFEYPKASYDVAVNQEYTDVGTIKRLMYEPWTDVSNGELNASYSEWVNEDLYVVDAAALIKPLREFVPKLIIKLGRLADRYLGKFLQATVSAGVKLEVNGSNLSRDYLNTFFVFAASTGRWRIDNINLFNNEDFDNDSY